MITITVPEARQLGIIPAVAIGQPRSLVQRLTWERRREERDKRRAERESAKATMAERLLFTFYVGLQ